MTGEDPESGDEVGYWGPALAIADAFSGAVTVEQTGEVFAGTVSFDPITGLPIDASGNGIEAAAAADADASLEQAAVQDNVNSQTATTSLDFAATAAFNTVAAAALDDVEIDAGIEDVEVELEQSQEDIEQENEAEQYGVADAYSAYTGFGETVTVIQSGTLVAADTGIEAEASSEAEAALEQLADQSNSNSQTATPTVALTAAPTFGTARRSKRL